MSAVAGTLLLLVFLLLVAVVVALWVIALMQIGRSQVLDSTGKAVWILIVVFAPFIGSIIWFALGKSSAGDVGPRPGGLR